MFRKIDPREIGENVFDLIGKQWMLITAGTMENCNTMTASWGSFGVLWEKPMSFCFVRPHRYTYEFMEKNDFFTLSFFEEKYRDALNFCGAHSGRDHDKIGKTGLTKVDFEKKAVYFKEAKLILILRKIYFQDINPENFLDKTIDSNYKLKDYHRMYGGEIISCLVKD